MLPAADGQWHVRAGGGHVWFVNEDPSVGPWVLADGELRPVVDAATDHSAPLIMPKVYA